MVRIASWSSLAHLIDGLADNDTCVEDRHTEADDQSDQQELVAHDKQVPELVLLDQDGKAYGQLCHEVDKRTDHECSPWFKG